MKYKIGDVVIFRDGEVDSIGDITNEDDPMYISSCGHIGYSDELKLFEDNIEWYLNTVKIDENKQRCKYWNIELEKTLSLTGILYDVYDEVCGGLLHIVTDDDNIADNHIQWCIENANQEGRDRSSYKISIVIANRYLNHSMKERMLLMSEFLHCDLNNRDCDKCYIELGYEAYYEREDY